MISLLTYAPLSIEDECSCAVAAQLVLSAKPQKINAAYELYEELVYGKGVNCDQLGVEVMFDDFAKHYGLFASYYQ